MMNRISIATVMVIALGILSACNQAGESGTGNSGSTAALDGWGDAPDIGYTTFSGTAAKLSDHQGRPLVVNFWAAWCPPCKKEMPEFEEVYKKYDGQFDLVAIAVDTRNDPVAFFASKGFTYTGAMGGRDVAKYMNMSIPVTAFIDRQGNLIHKQEGMISGAVFEKHLKKIL